MIFDRFRNKANTSVAPSRQRRRTSGRPTTISSEVIIEGHLVTNGEIQIDGTINGDVRARVCVVDANGVIHGEVYAEEVLVRGRVIGPIRGIHVHILAGGHVEGDVINETLSVENGAYIDGKIRRSEDPLSEPIAAGYYGEPDEPQLTYHHTMSAPAPPPLPPPPHQFGVIDEDGFHPIDVPQRGPKAAE
jgi:cytoskeletal protein CcmA (bactofilin family)